MLQQEVARVQQQCQESQQRLSSLLAAFNSAGSAGAAGEAGWLFVRQLMIHGLRYMPTGGGFGWHSRHLACWQEPGEERDTDRQHLSVQCKPPGRCQACQKGHAPKVRRTPGD